MVGRGVNTDDIQVYLCDICVYIICIMYRVGD